MYTAGPNRTGSYARLPLDLSAMLTRQLHICICYLEKHKSSAVRCARAFVVGVGKQTSGEDDEVGQKRGAGITGGWKSYLRGRRKG